VFSRDDIKQLLNQYVLVQLYTDKVPTFYQDATTPEQNKQLLEEKFGTGALPYYVVVEPTPDGGFRKVASYGDVGNGLINDVPDFARWLRENVGTK